MPLCVATFNLENLDDGPNLQPTLADRIRIRRPQLLRLRADVLCLQEVHSQGPGGARTLAALDALLAGTDYVAFRHDRLRENMVGLGVRGPGTGKKEIRHPSPESLAASPQPPVPSPQPPAPQPEFLQCHVANAITTKTRNGENAKSRAVPAAACCLRSFVVSCFRGPNPCPLRCGGSAW